MGRTRTYILQVVRADASRITHRYSRSRAYDATPSGESLPAPDPSASHVASFRVAGDRSPKKTTSPAATSADSGRGAVKTCCATVGELADHFVDPRHARMRAHADPRPRLFKLGGDVVQDVRVLLERARLADADELMVCQSLRRPNDHGRSYH